jgi:dTMP kinase
MTHSGLFITLEGADAAGKSSHVEAIKTHLEQTTGKHVIMTREPGGTPLAEEIRMLVKGREMSPATETLLLNAARQDHLDRVIRPALAAGHVVVCDRFTDSTYAYQGGVKKFSMDKITALKDWVQEGLQPDLTLYFDVPLEVSKARRDLRGEASDRLEDAMDANFNALRDVYLAMADGHQQRVVVINGIPPLDVVRQSVVQTLDRFLLKRKVVASPKEPSRPRP